jgi:hypothetical protein
LADVSPPVRENWGSEAVIPHLAWITRDLAGFPVADVEVDDLLVVHSDALDRRRKGFESAADVARRRDESIRAERRCGRDGHYEDRDHDDDRCGARALLESRNSTLDSGYPEFVQPCVQVLEALAVVTGGVLYMALEVRKLRRGKRVEIGQARI